MKKTLLTFFVLTIFIFTIQAQSIRYVKQGGAGAADGTSWANASGSLQAMINVTGVTEVWVAAGIYKPTSTTNPAIAFHMLNGVSILGGFPATGNPLITDRDWNTNITILSGDIGTIGDSIDNSYQVIKDSSGYTLNNTAIINGFTIKDGYSVLQAGYGYGGGMYARHSPTIMNCKFINNTAKFGGGLFCQSGSAIVTNCDFSYNRVTGGGGGMFNFGNATTPIITNCNFSNNKADYGGGMGSENCLPTITNCNFFYNTATTNCGGFYNQNSDAIVTNCNAVYNTAGNQTGVGIYNTNFSYPFITNCIVWGNSSGTQITGNGTVSYSIVQGGYTGTGNLATNPLFVDTVNGDFSLTQCSPAINFGLDSVNNYSTDLAGNPRIYDSIIDIGAYEFQNLICITGLKNIDKTSNSITLKAQPNPFHTIFTVSFENMAAVEYVQLQVFDIAGKEIYNVKHAISNNIELNLAGGAGIYFLKATNKQGIQQQLKLVKLE
jgi:hypothetical protein